MTPCVNLLFFPYTWDLMRVMSFSWYLAKTCADRQPCLFLTDRKRLPFHIHAFLGPAYLTDILYNNLHILRHRYNYSARALLVYLDISNKYLLVNITQAFCFFFQRLVQHVCHWYGWNTNCVFAYINFFRIVLPSHLFKYLNKWNKVFFLSGFSSQTLTIHRTEGEGRGPSFIPLYHFLPLTNNETFIFNLTCEMTIMYF